MLLREHEFSAFLSSLLPASLGSGSKGPSAAVGKPQEKEGKTMVWGGGGTMAGRPAECPERLANASCHHIFQSPAWEPEEQIREPNTYYFFCLRCQA